MLKEKETVIRRAMIIFDAFIVVISFFLAYFIREHFLTFYHLDLFPSDQIVGNLPSSISEYLVILFFIAPILCGMLYVNGMYRPLRIRAFHDIVWIILKSSFFMLLIFGTIVFLFKLEFVSRMFFVIFFVVSLTLILLEKITVFSFMRYIRKRGLNYRSLLVVGAGERAARLIKKIQDHPEWGIRVLGAIDDEPDRRYKRNEYVKIIGELNDLSQILHNQVIDEVVFVVPRSRLNYMENAIYTCETEGIKATIAVDLFDLKIARAFPTEIGDIPLVRFETTIADEWQLFIKRIIDVVLSGLVIVLLSPFLLVIAILIKLTSSGPVLFKQERLSLNGRQFVLYKYRTMYERAQKDLANVDVFNEMDNPSFREKKIKYMTPVGRILRKFSIDEFPQVFNVFAGHMSLIGPRPPVPEEVSQYKPWQRRRLSMRPGLTCLWQISGRNKIDFNEWMNMDLEYIDNWSLWLDFKILVKTIPAVLFGIGAY